jgi:putative transcriptional regulator
MAKEAVIKNSVHQYRTKLGYTQEGLAEAVGVTRQTIISIERGNYTPSVLLALKIAAVFNVSVEAVFKITYE